MTKTEAELFNYLKSHYIPDLVFSRNQMSRWDCYSPDKKYRIELKCRRKHYDSMLIEKKKYDALKQEANKHKDRPIYICSTPKGVWAFDLNNFKDIEWLKKSMPEKTDFKGNKWIKKEIAYLELAKGFKL